MSRNVDLFWVENVSTATSKVSYASSAHADNCQSNNCACNLCYLKKLSISTDFWLSISKNSNVSEKTTREYRLSRVDPRTRLRCYLGKKQKKHKIDIACEYNLSFDLFFFHNGRWPIAALTNVRAHKLNHTIYIHRIRYNKKDIRHLRMINISRMYCIFVYSIFNIVQWHCFIHQLIEYVLVFICVLLVFIVTLYR